MISFAQNELFSNANSEPKKSVNAFVSLGKSTVVDLASFNLWVNSARDFRLSVQKLELTSTGAKIEFGWQVMWCKFSVEFNSETQSVDIWK